MTRRKRFYDSWGFDTSEIVKDEADISQAIRGPVGCLDTLIA